MRLDIKELLDFFDNEKDDIRHDISSVISVVGEDLGAALFKHYYEEVFVKKVIVSRFPVLGVVDPVTRKSSWLDRWIYIEKSKNKFTAYQTEIKNWSAYALGARKIGKDPKETRNDGYKTWKDRLKRLKHKDKNGENKVFYPMKKPKDFPNKAVLEPLIIYWFVLSKDGKKTEPFFKVNIRVKGKIRKLNVFSMSNYLRSIKNKKKPMILDMPSAEKRIKLLSKYFPI